MQRKQPAANPHAGPNRRDGGSAAHQARTQLGAMLHLARVRRSAVGAFTCYTFEGFEALVQAAAWHTAPAIALVSASSFRRRGGDRLVRAFRAMAERAPTPILVQLDHVSDLQEIERAIAVGVDAVMADGSRLPYEDNIAFTREAIALARPHGIGVEAELGRIEGTEDRAAEVLSSEMTDPRQAAEFVERTDVDCLAVAVGNVHGHYAGIPALDWGRLEEASSRISTPLSLHGASGLPDTDLRRAANAGSAKFNVNTELRAAYFASLTDGIPMRSADLDLQGLVNGSVHAVAQVIGKKLDVFGWPANGELPDVSHGD